MLILRKPSLQSVLWQKVAELHAYLVRCFCVGSGVKQFFDNQDVALFHRVKQRCLSFLSGNKSHIRLHFLQVISERQVSSRARR